MPAPGEAQCVRAGSAARNGRRTNRKNTNRKSTRLNSSHANISYAVFCLKKKKRKQKNRQETHQSDTTRQVNTKRPLDTLSKYRIDHTAINNTADINTEWNDKTDRQRFS